MKHKKDCTVHHLTFGGHCLNCGLNEPKTVQKSKSEKVKYLKALGFKFEK